MRPELSLKVTAMPTNSMTLTAGAKFLPLACWTAAHGPVRAVSEAPDALSCVELGPGTVSIEHTIRVEPSTKYRLSISLMTESGAEEVRLGVRNHGRAEKATAMSWVSFRKVELFFSTGGAATSATLFVLHPSGPGRAWAKDVELEALGPADDVGFAGVYNSIKVPELRVPVSDLGVAQLPNEKLDWLLDDRFGMFVHWGLYAGPGRGEWLRYAEKIPEDQYKLLAERVSGDEYFAADQFDPREWAAIAKAAGMKWICLTTRHHDGYNLFRSPHPNSFDSWQTHGRDFIAEYTAALREAGLKVGIYYSPLNWRYPGVFDIHGDGCKPNNLGFTSAESNFENARLFKEENYANVRHLLTHYGKIDLIFWDGGWLGHSGTDADAAGFHESGRYLSAENPWKIGEQWIDREVGSGKPLGIMGMVRKHQPDALTNTRYGWIGDIFDEEQGPPASGPIRSAVYNKCITSGSSWGFSRTNTVVHSPEYIIEHLANAAVRNMAFQFNVGPDRHGVIPSDTACRLAAVGNWLKRMGEGIFGVRSGPWQPEDGEYGYTYRGATLYVHLFAGFSGTTFRIPPVGQLNVRSARLVSGGASVEWSHDTDRTVLLSNIDRLSSPVDTIIAVEFDHPVMTFASIPRAGD